MMTTTPPVRQRSLLEDGLLCGLVGAGLLAAWFLGIDLLRGEPLLTPAVLSAVVFDGGVADPILIDAKGVFAYSGLHVIAFLLLGGAMAYMFREFEIAPDFGTGYLCVFVLFEIILFSIQVAMTGDVRDVLGPLQTAVGNALSAVGMFWFLARRHPNAVPALAEAWNSQPPLR